ncbi:putative secreted protein [Pusillimonas sp. T7-7]|nr:putative secreted protein [Pusillimonas sp. T7-7]
MQKNQIMGLAKKMAGFSIAGAGALALSSSLAMAQSWPEKPVSLVVPFAAGGTTDVLARALGDELSKSLGQPVIVENKPGAGATLGADIVSRAKPDGYTLLMGAVHHTIATSVYKNLSYDFQKSFDPVTIVALVPNVLVINAANTPAKTPAELVDIAKKSANSLPFGSNGYGTLQHLIGTQFSMQNNIELLHDHRKLAQGNGRPNRQ